MKDKINIRPKGNHHYFMNFKNSMILLIIYSFLFILITEEKPIDLINFASEINLVIKGSGNQSLLNNSFNIEPSEVYVNGIYKGTCKMFCELDYEINNITLIFNNTIKSCEIMFSESVNIKEIDLSNFDFSDVITMENMFRNCKNIEKINFGNINTSSVIDMNRLFYNCLKLTSLDISNFDTSSVTSIEGMFYGCSDLLSIDLSNFNTTKVKIMCLLFYKCSKLTSIDISNFDISKVNDMSYLFRDCKLLKSIKLWNMNTSSVRDMRGLFYYCESLESIDLSSFDTSSVTLMGYMFFRCYSLKSIILPETFNTSNVVSMYAMFSHCKTLISLNLSIFDTSQVTDMGFLFDNCIELKYLDISNFSPLNISSIDGIFHNMSSLVYLNIYSFEINEKTNKSSSFTNLPSNIKICANKLNMKNYLSSINITNNCSDICFQENIKVDINNNQCINSCKENGYNYEYANICYQDSCPENTHAIIKNISNKEKVYEEFEDNVAICLDRNPEGYYLDEDGFYLKCFESCKHCYGLGDKNINNCTKCNINFIFIDDSIYNTNCYEKCQYYYYFDENDNYKCTENCSDNYNKLIIEKDQCIDKCSNDSIYKYEYNNICYKKCPNGTIYVDNEEKCLDKKIIEATTIIKESSNISTINIMVYEETQTSLNKMETNNNSYNIENIEVITNIITQTNLDITKYNYSKTEIITNEMDKTSLIKTNIDYYHTEIAFDELNIIVNESTFKNIKEHLFKSYKELKNGKDMEVQTKNILFTMTNTYNQKYNKNENKNKTTIDLGECENELKLFYNISKNESLYILKIDVEEEGMKIPKIEFEVYFPLNSSDLTKLNLSVCQNKKIDISIPVKITEDISKYNSSSNYYNDICTKATTDSNSDISLNDRKKEFIDNNMTLCDENCELVDYNYTIEKVKCSCLVKISLPLIEDIKFDKDKLYKSFIDIKNLANINFMKCYKNVFNKGLIKNYGFFIYIFIIILYFICLFLFGFKFYSLLKNEINKIIKAKNDIFMAGTQLENSKIQKMKINTTKVKRKTIKKKKFKKKKNNHHPPKIKNEKTNIITNNGEIFDNNSKNKLQINLDNNHINNLQNFNVKKKFNSKSENILKKNDNELNELSYKDALIYDKRTYIQYYFSLLKTNHLLLFSFYVNNKDYNSQIIKMFLFFLYFSVDFAINALFFSDDTLHKIYIDKGKFNFIYQIPIIIYSSLISSGINILIKYLALSENIILEIKNEKKIEEFKLKKNSLYKKLKIKFILFFITSFILLLLFMYYITCFCGIYINTQIHLIKDSVISFVLSLVYPFGIYIFPCAFRVISLRAKNKNKECLYKFSKILQNL